MLVRTPHPKPTESLYGYILRITEANGYDSPWHVLAYAGHNQGEMQGPGIPADKLVSVLGLQPGALSSIAYSTIGSKGERKYTLLGHPLGKRLNYDPLRLDKPQFCPHCVKEHGYIDAFFDLSLAVACPSHNCTLVSHCPVCEEPLSMFRPGLLTCKCGASLHDAPTELVSPALSDLMAILWAKLHGSSIGSIVMRAGLPANELLGADLFPLLLKLPALGRLGATHPQTDNLSYRDIADNVASILADWPNGIAPFLARLREINDREVHLLGSRKSFAQLYNRFINERHAAGGFNWLRDEILRHRWLGNHFDREDKLPSSAGSCAGLAAALAISKVSLRSWADQARTCEAPVGGKIKIRAAAAYLEMPVRVLRAIQASGHSTDRKQTKGSGWFNLNDLSAFRQQLLALSPLLGADEGQAGKLEDMANILRIRHFHSSEGKASFVLAYLSGAIKAVGRTGDTLKDIQFRSSDVTAFVSASRAAAADNSVSVRDAAVLLRCDVRGVPGLITAGHLTSIPGKEGLRVKRESIDRFTSQFVALNTLATERETSTRRLHRLAKSGDVPVMLVDGTHAGPVPFIKREHIGRLIQLSDANPARKPDPDFKNRTLNAVRQYLGELKIKGEPLPRCGKKPNRRDIANACGFDRSVFYNNDAVAQLIADYAEAEAAACG